MARSSLELPELLERSYCTDSLTDGLRRHSLTRNFQRGNWGRVRAICRLLLRIDEWKILRYNINTTSAW